MKDTDGWRDRQGKIEGKKDKQTEIDKTDSRGWIDKQRYTDKTGKAGKTEERKRGLADKIELDKTNKTDRQMVMDRDTHTK